MRTALGSKVTEGMDTDTDNTGQGAVPEVGDTGTDKGSAVGKGSVQVKAVADPVPVRPQ